MQYYNTPLDLRNPRCNHCQANDFVETSTEWVCQSCGTCHDMPVFVATYDQLTYSAPIEVDDGRRIPIHILEKLCSQLNVGDESQNQIIKLLKEASGRLHLKERVIGAAIYFVTGISFARIGLFVGKEELSKGCADLRKEMLLHPHWEPIVKQFRKEAASNSIYTNLNSIISHMKLSQDDNIILRKKINKLDQLVGDKHPKGLVRDVTIMWMAIKLIPLPFSLKKVGKAADVCVQSILRTERTLRDALGL